MEKKMKFTIENDIVVGNQDPDLLEKRGVAQLILEILSNHPDVVGEENVETGEKLTFAEMKDRSVRCALWLKKQNLKKDDIVAVSTFTQMNDFVPVLACFYTCTICSPWSNEISSAEAEYFFDLVKPKIMFACEESVEMLAETCRKLGLNCKFVVISDEDDSYREFATLKSVLAEQSQAEVDNYVASEFDDPLKDVSMIFFSSGTTGNPKGTMLTPESFVNPHTTQGYSRDFSKNLWYANVSWTAGVYRILSSIRTKSTRIIHREFEPEETSKVVEKYQVNKLFLSPAKMTEMCSANILDRYKFPSIEVVSFGGAKSNRPVVEAFRKALPHALVLNGYGMTELGGIACLQPENCKGIDSNGYVVEHVKMKVLDTETGRVLGANKEGELCFQVYNKMIGYFKNEEATKAMIDAEGWLHSGDLGYYDENGEVFVTNRIKEVIITKNRKVAPSKIVEILLGHPAVLDATVVAVPHELDGERPLAFVIKRPDVQVTDEELMQLPKKFNKFYEITGGIIFIDEFPLNSSGKKNFKMLKAMASEKSAQSLKN